MPLTSSNTLCRKATTDAKMSLRHEKTNREMWGKTDNVVIKIFFIPWFQDYESFKSDTFSDKTAFMTFASPTILRHLHRSGISLLHPRTQDVKPAGRHRTDRRTAGEIYKVKTANIVFLGLFWSYWWYIFTKNWSIMVEVKETTSYHQLYLVIFYNICHIIKINNYIWLKNASMVD